MTENRHLMLSAVRGPTPYHQQAFLAKPERKLDLPVDEAQSTLRVVYSDHGLVLDGAARAREDEVLCDDVAVDADAILTAALGRRFGWVIVVAGDGDVGDWAWSVGDGGGGDCGG